MLRSAKKLKNGTGDLMRLAITQTVEENKQLTLMGKNSQMSQNKKNKDDNKNDS